MTINVASGAPGQIIQSSVTTAPYGRPVYGPKAGNSWFVDMTNQAAVSAIFDVTNFTFGTDQDGTTKIITPTSTSLASLHLKAPRELRHCDVLVRYRTNAAASTSTDFRVWGRRIDDNNGWYAKKSFAATPNVEGHHVWNSSDSSVVTASADTDTTGTGWRYLRLRLLGGNLVQVKSWLEANAEPDWQISATIDVGAVSSWMQSSGGAGVSVTAPTAGFNISHVGITELQWPGDFNVLQNIDGSIADSRAGTPAFWTPTNCDMVTLADQYGDSRSVFHGLKVNAGDAGFNWEQWIYPLQRIMQFGTNKHGPAMLAEYPRAFECSIWSKGNNVVHGTGTIGAMAAVLYYYDAVGTGLNTGQPDYYHTLGPNPLGDGTWGWTETKWRIHLNGFEKVGRARISIGSHDSDCTGEMWWTDPILKPVA